MACNLDRKLSTSPNLVIVMKIKTDSIERFSFERRKLFGFESTTLYHWLKNSRHVFVQSEDKPKQIVTR